MCLFLFVSACLCFPWGRTSQAQITSFTLSAVTDLCQVQIQCHVSVIERKKTGLWVKKKNAPLICKTLSGWAGVWLKAEPAGPLRRHVNKHVLEAAVHRSGEVFVSSGVDVQHLASNLSVLQLTSYLANLQWPQTTSGPRRSRLLCVSFAMDIFFFKLNFCLTK